MFGSKKSNQEDLERELRESGGRATAATVLTNKTRGRKAGGTGERYIGLHWTVLTQDMKVRVEPPGEEPFEARLVVHSKAEDKKLRPLDEVIELEFTHPMIAVIYDPGDHSRIAFDGSPEGQASAKEEQRRRRIGTARTTTAGESASPARPVVDPVARLKELADLRDRGVITDEQLKQQSEKLLGDT